MLESSFIKGNQARGQNPTLWLAVTFYTVLDNLNSRNVYFQINLWNIQGPHGHLKDEACILNLLFSYVGMGLFAF